MSHRLLLILVVFGLSFSQVYAAKTNTVATLTPTVQLTVKAAKSIYKNGDRIEVLGTGCPANAEIMSAVMIVQDESGKNSFRSLEKKDLQIGPDGTLSGYVIPQQLTEDDRSARIVLSVKGANVKASQAVTIEGDLTPTNFAMLDLSDDQFAFSEFSGDHVVQLNERLDIDSSGTGFTGNLLACYRLEYADAVGGGVDSLTNFNQDAIQALDPTSLHFDGGMLTGYTNSTETPYAPATESIRLAIQYGTLAFGNTAVSIDYISTLDNIPPQLISARTIDPTHIEVTFDEQLTVPAVNGDAIDNWSLTSQGGTNYSVNAASNLGETVISCTLNVTPALNRSQRPLLNFTQQADYQDLQGNAAATVNNLRATDGIPPGDIVLFLGDDANPFSVGDFIGASPIALIAHVDDGIAGSDSALDGVLFQGSDNGSSWTNIGIATDEEIWGLGGDSAKYSITWDASLTTRQFKMIRAIAFDGGPNGVLGMNDLFEPGIDNSTTSNTIGEAADGNVISGLNKNFKDTYRFVISSVNPATIQAGTGDERSEITLAVQDNYGSLRNTTGVSNILRFSESSTTTESWWSAATGGSPEPNYIEVNVSSSTTSASVWYSNTASGGPNTLVLAEPAGNLGEITVNANGETISVTASGATRLLAALPGQSFQNGVGITGSPTSQSAGTPFNMNLYIVDDGNNLALETSNRTVEFTSNASAAPDGTLPIIDGQNSDNWTGVSVQFTDGVSDDIIVALYNAESGITFTANSGTLTGVQSSSVSVDPGVLGNFLFVMSSPQTDGFQVTGTNRLTARDNYNNIKTDFDASVDNVTISGIQSGGGGSATLSGLSGGNILNQAGDFINGVADLTEDGLNIDVSQTGDYIFTAQTAGGATGSTGTISMITRRVTVSAPNTDADATIDASSSNTDLFLSASISGEEDPGLGDDFQIVLAVNNTGVPGTYDLTDATGDLAVSGGTLSAVIPAADLRQASGSRYLFWWIQNMSANPNATTIAGTPNSDSPARLVINPTLITEGGINNGDISGGGFTPGTSNQEVVSIKFSSDPAEATIISNLLLFEKSGSAITSDISGFHLYQDNAPLGVLDGGDVLLGNAPYYGGPLVNFSGLDLPILGNNVYILVTVDVLETANPLNTLGLRLGNPGSIVLADNVLNGPSTAINIQSFSNVGTSTDYSLPVSVSVFSAKSDYGKISLTWETASEVDNAGFYLSRADNESGPFTAINPQIIQGAGNSNETHKYEFVDDNVVEDATYFYKLSSQDFNGTRHDYRGIASGKVLPLPKVFSLNQNYPNPFNPSTQISFAVANESTVNLDIYNMLGQKVRTLINNQRLEPGVYNNYSWNARDDNGNSVANGIYYMVLTAKEFQFRSVKKIIYMK